MLLFLVINEAITKQDVQIFLIKMVEATKKKKSLTSRLFCDILFWFWQPNPIPVELPQKKLVQIESVVLKFIGYKWAYGTTYNMNITWLRIVKIMMMMIIFFFLKIPIILLWFKQWTSPTRLNSKKEDILSKIKFFVRNSILFLILWQS